MLLRKVNTHPFDMDSNQIDVGLILDKKEKKVHPSAAKLLSRNDKLHPETTLAVSMLLFRYSAMITVAVLTRFILLPEGTGTSDQETAPEEDNDAALVGRLRKSVR